MKIIDIGICIDNNDPKAIGRIRFRPYGMLVSDSANAIKYEEWDKNDPFMAISFLPAHINIIPQVQQSVKIIKYDTDKDTHNIEYISGPYSSPHDLQNETFVSQHRDTTYGGVIVKSIKDIRNKNGSVNPPVKSGTIIKPNDVGFRGNYGTDIIFTENGIQLRGGMLVDKQNGGTSLLDYPTLAKKMGRFSLKKFPQTKKLVSETVETSTLSSSRLKYIVEYEIDNLDAPTQLKLFVYKVVSGYGTEFNTNVFGESSVFSTTDTTKVKLVNSGSTLSDPTYVKYLDEHTISASYIELREALHLIDIDGLVALDSSFPNEDVHPLYYRPTSYFKTLKGSTEAENINKQLFLSKVQVRNKIGGAGLIYSIGNADPPLIPNKKTTSVPKVIKNSGEQSFSALSADRVFLLSTTPNIGANTKTVKFGELNEYELTQEDYIEKIEPNTYSTVRGDILYAFLSAVKNLLDSHIHNINEPPVQTDPNWIKLNELMSTLRNELLNDSIRIN